MTVQPSREESGVRVNVLLINPPSPFLLDDRVFPPLGVLQVAAALEAEGHAVHVADLAGLADPWSALKPVVEEGWDVYGFTATTPQFPVTVGLAQKVREHDPGKKIIIGGPHATVQPDSCGDFDTTVLGDGEAAILEAIQPGSPARIDAASATKKGLLDWKWPARHLIDMASYQYRLAGRLGTSAVWSMGCPYGCNFCCGRLVPYYRRVRSREVADVVREMSHLGERYGIGAITAFDDEVNLLNEPLIDICNGLAPLGMNFRAFIKSNLFNDRQAEAMAKAGFVQVCTGIESGSDRILGVMQKQTSFEINLRARELARKHGLQFKAFCSVGHVGETYEDAQETKRWLLTAKPDDFDVTVITVYPGTPIYNYREYVGDKDGHRVCKYVYKSKRPEENGATLFFEEIDYAKEFAFYKGRPKEYVSHVWTPDLSKEDLGRVRDEIEDEVRVKLGIPYPKRYSGDHLDTVAPSLEHSMGQGASPQNA